MNEQVHGTIFLNQRKVPVDVYEAGKRMLTLPPGAQDYREAVLGDPEICSYCRWSEVIFKANGEVGLIQNKAWRPPIEWAEKKYFQVELLNSGGSIIEGAYKTTAGENMIRVYKGIPRLVAVKFDSPLARYKKIEWVKEKKKIPNPDNPNFLIEIQEIKKVTTLRSKDELAQIEKAFRERAKERAEKELEGNLKAAGLSKR